MTATTMTTSKLCCSWCSCKSRSPQKSAAVSAEKAWSSGDQFAVKNGEAFAFGKKRRRRMNTTARANNVWIIVIVIAERISRERVIRAPFQSAFGGCSSHCSGEFRSAQKQAAKSTLDGNFIGKRRTRWSRLRRREKDDSDDENIDIFVTDAYYEYEYQRWRKRFNGNDSARINQPRRARSLHERDRSIRIHS